MSPLKTCKQCKKEYYAVRVTSKYCSPKCRKLAFQTDEVTVPSTQENAKQGTLKLDDYSAQDLYNAIDAYPQDTWIDSPEFVELKRRLKSKNIDTLQKEGYYVPNWKKTQKKDAKN